MIEGLLFQHILKLILMMFVGFAAVKTKILKSEAACRLVKGLNNQTLSVVSEASDHLSTNLWHSPMGAHQLLGIGLRASITGKHAYYVITDDICNLTDRISHADYSGS